MKQRRVTFIEGWTFRQVKEGLKANSRILYTINELSDQQIMEKLGDNGDPEGLFSTDTYFFTFRETDFQILRQAYDRMQTILKRAWQSRSKSLPYKNSYQALIVASLIEKETALYKECPEIAGVILRRLKKECLYKECLYKLDPTVLYGLGRSYDSPITKEDLVFHTPYDTYQNYELPPTSIDMPSRGSILAAVNSTLWDTFYYVALGGDVSHVFSPTYQANHEAVKKYQRNDEEIIIIPAWVAPCLSLGEKYGK